MTINELNKQLQKSLRKFIKDRKHIRTGALYNSVEFDCKDNKELNIHFSSKFYIQYLENRKFVDLYFSSDDFNDIITNYTIGTLTDLIYSNDLKK
jgi:hypothetical protein